MKGVYRKQISRIPFDDIREEMVFYCLLGERGSQRGAVN